MQDLSGARRVPHNIIARGEVSGHAHIAVGAVTVLELGGELFLDVQGEAAIRHLLEEAFVMEKRQVWTGEHSDIPLEPGLYKYIPQIEFDLFSSAMRRARD
jgi:hypothetical protein